MKKFSFADIAKHPLTRITLGIFSAGLILTLFLLNRCDQNQQLDLPGTNKTSEKREKEKQFFNQTILKLVDNNQKEIANREFEFQIFDLKTSTTGKIKLSTDNSGVVTINPETTNPCRITIKHPDYKLKTFTLNPAKPGKLKIVKLEQALVLQGKIQDKDKKPVKNAKITITDSETDTVETIFSNKEGKFSFQGEEKKIYLLDIEKSGFEKINKRFFSSTDNQAVITLDKITDVFVEVISPEGKPLPGAKVIVAGAALWPPQIYTTDKNGKINLQAVSDKSYSFSASWKNLTNSIEDILFAENTTNIVHLHLEKGYFLEGKVRDARNGKPVANAIFSIGESQVSMIVKEVQTDKEGKFKIGPLLPGKYGFSLAAKGYVSLSGQNYWIGEKNPPALFDLSKGLTLKGQIVDKKGIPVEGAIVEIWGIDRYGRLLSPLALSSPNLINEGELGIVSRKVTIGMQANGATITNKNGKFALRGIPPGWLALKIRNKPYLPGHLTLGLTAENKNDIYYKLKRGKRLTGYITDKISTPLKGVEIRVESPSLPEYSYTTFTDAKGNFELEGIPDQVALTYNHPGYLPKTEILSPQLEHKVVLRKGTKKITLRLQDSHQFPLKECPVELVSQNGSEGYYGKTDKNGEISFSQLDDKTYLATILPSEYPRYVTEPLKPGIHNLELPYGGGFSGFVRDVDTKAGLKAEIKMVHSSGDEINLKTEDGEFTVGNLAAGTWKLQISSPDYITLKQNIKIESGNRPGAISSGEKLFELSPGGDVKGIVVDNQGFPVKFARVVCNNNYIKANLNGKFVLKNITPGQQKLQAWKMGKGYGEKTVEVDKMLTTSGVSIKINSASGKNKIKSGLKLEKLHSEGKTLIADIKPKSPSSRTQLKEGDEVLFVNGLSSGLPIFFLNSQLEGKTGEVIYLITGNSLATAKHVFIFLKK
ncbi:MAG: MSCRAMM family protein [Myxococcota bacterium]